MSKQTETRKTDDDQRPRQVDIVRRQRAFGDSLREWLHDREIKAVKREKAKAKKRAAATAKRDKARAKKLGVKYRGTSADRVPAALRVDPIKPQWVHRHAPHWTEHGRRQKGTPYINPDRDARSAKSGRLRKDLVR